MSTLIGTLTGFIFFPRAPVWQRKDAARAARPAAGGAAPAAPEDEVILGLSRDLGTPPPR